MKVQSLMSKKILVCGFEESLSTAAQLMWDGDCGAIPVMDHNGKAIGMITDRDICMATYTQGLPPQAIAVKTAMSRELVACAPTDTVAQAERLMRDHKIRRLPVIDEHGDLVGLLSLNDLALQFGREKLSRQKEVRGSELAETLAAVCQPRPMLLPTAAVAAA